MTETPHRERLCLAALDLKDAVHIGHSTGGGEAAHYAARAKPGRLQS